MPPHPPSLLGKIYDNFGLYNTGFKIASDFEIFLRFIYVNKTNFHKLNKIAVRMRMEVFQEKIFKVILYQLKKYHNLTKLIKLK